MCKEAQRDEWWKVVIYDEWGARVFYVAGKCHRVVVRSVLVGWTLLISMTYFIVKWAVGSFLHCALPLLIPDLNDHNRVDVLTHQLAGLRDGYGNLQHKAVWMHSGPGCSFTQEELGEAGQEGSITYLIILGSDLSIMDLSQQFWSSKRKFNVFIISSSKNVLLDP